MEALERLSRTYLPAVESELQRMVSLSRQDGTEEMYRMLAYHMGWQGEGAGVEARGKRIRPLLVLLTCASVGGEWECALPGAAAVELVHNFSLVHDDIQDESPLRRGRPTVWTKWGVAQAINAGDALFTLSQMAIMNLVRCVPIEATLEASKTLQKACLALTQGQFLDLAYEGRLNLVVEDYWRMVGGKTAALLSACTYIGALAGQAASDLCQLYRRFGELLGLAFQAQDDWLGIWGNAALTGKSTSSDLVSRKKTLPVLFGLGQQGEFAARWALGKIQPEEAQALAEQLEREGGRAYTQEQADKLTRQALGTLKQAQPRGEAGEALVSLTEYLLKRQH